FSGPSHLKHRLTKYFFGFYHIAYFRGLMFNPENIVGYSDKLYYKGAHRFFFLRSIFNTLLCDLMLVTSRISAEYAVKRQVDKKQIVDIGPVWLTDVERDVAESDQERTEICFITQAFNAHGFPEQHNDQLRVL